MGFRVHFSGQGFFTSASNLNIKAAMHRHRERERERQTYTKSVSLTEPPWLKQAVSYGLRENFESNNMSPPQAQDALSQLSSVGFRLRRSNTEVQYRSHAP